MALQQLCGPWRARSRAALRPLGLLSPPARPLGPGPGPGLAARGAGGDADAGLDENRFHHKYRHRLRALRRWAGPAARWGCGERSSALQRGALWGRSQGRGGCLGKGRGLGRGGVNWGGEGFGRGCVGAGAGAGRCGGSVSQLGGCSRRD